MTLAPLTWTLVEKSAHDNGFDLEGPPTDDWRTFTSSQTSLRIWLSGVGDSLFIVAMSRREVFEALNGLGTAWKNQLPQGASSARSTGDFSTLHRLLRRAFQLSRSLPHEPLQVFLQRTAMLPITTEAERLVVQRVGQDIFRNGLVDYWEGRCPLSGLAAVELLRASHIKPWADCESDAERLDVFNGLLLAPHFDALFDCGLITINDDGSVLLSDSFDSSARVALSITSPMQLSSLTDAHRDYLSWHRTRVFRGSNGSS